MTEEKPDIKKISDLTQYKYFIPNYQRGYRWKEQNILDLLNDIMNFKSNKNEDWYCLQPIVVKYINENEFEVIDGQQRLSTIALILHCFSQGNSLGSNKLTLSNNPDLNNISFKYETRKNTEKYINNPYEIPNDIIPDEIDIYYLSKAYSTIKKWIEKNLSNQNNYYEYFKKFTIQTKIIWYETDKNEDSIEIFTRLNTGKIRLVDAELIKALFLNSSNYNQNKPENKTIKDRTYATQFEIAVKWDEIEHSLQDDKFWFFLTGANKEERNQKENRIDLIFKIMANLLNDNTDDNQNYKVFRYFYELINSKKITQNPKENIEDVTKLWRDGVQKCYMRFYEWYQDRELYHKIGFILCESGKNKLKDLYDIADFSTKTEFKQKLDEIIKNLIKFKKADKTYVTDIFDELNYEDNYPEIKRILLLYNIISMIEDKKENKEETEKSLILKDTSFFPFHAYKKMVWNLEHIASRQDDAPKNKDVLPWLKGTLPHINENKELKKNILTLIEELSKINDCNNYNEKQKSKIAEIYRNTITYFSGNIDEDGKNRISNLALLDEKTNKSYGNKVFPKKRREIIEQEQKGVFVPICTKKVFYKCLPYENEYPNISFWTKGDIIAYKKDIETVLAKYLNKQKV